VSKTDYSQGQAIEYLLPGGTIWMPGDYVHLVPGPDSDGPDARVRVRDSVGDVLSVPLTLVRPAEAPARIHIETDAHAVKVGAQSHRTRYHVIQASPPGRDGFGFVHIRNNYSGKAESFSLSAADWAEFRRQVNGERAEG
jgi:hypothetical protein